MTYAVSISEWNDLISEKYRLQNSNDALLEACKGLVEQLEYVLETKNTMGAYSQLEHAKRILNQATK